MKPSLKDHFEFIKHIKPNVVVTAITKEGSTDRVKKWNVNSAGFWVQDNTYIADQKETEDIKTEKNHWHHVLLVNGDSLSLFYRDAEPYRLSPAFIVKPTPKFYSYNKDKKPTIFTEYYIKDAFETIHRILPELEGMF